MQTHTIQEKNRLEMHVSTVNYLVVSNESLLKRLGIPVATLPGDVIEFSAFRTRVETTAGALFEAAKFHAASVKTPEAIENETELLDLIRAIVALNGNPGHEKIKELAKQVSTNPKVVERARKKLEALVAQFIEKIRADGKGVMDIIRHRDAVKKQCFFGA